mmetsp:Transcript_8927/g.18915  ORF Transcript_8927/g.18915 Transcript_8927/m.18915 type:complete len:222 (-) Transcript_8927:89-754(-)
MGSHPRLRRQLVMTTTDELAAIREVVLQVVGIQATRDNGFALLDAEIFDHDRKPKEQTLDATPRCVSKEVEFCTLLHLDTLIMIPAPLPKPRKNIKKLPLSGLAILGGKVSIPAIADVDKSVHPLHKLNQTRILFLLDRFLYLVIRHRLCQHHKYRVAEQLRHMIMSRLMRRRFAVLPNPQLISHRRHCFSAVEDEKRNRGELSPPKQLSCPTFLQHCGVH